MNIKRLRVFAGPNGSGKSALYNYLLSQNYFHQYYYINADEIASRLLTGYDIFNWPVSINDRIFIEYLENSTFGEYFDINDIKKNITIANNNIQWHGESKNLSYLAASVADFLRNSMLSSGSSFSCETVFSHPSKLAFLENAKNAGYKIYLYFIATKNPVINIDRVTGRVKQGGHSVPEDKITERYYRTMDNLYNALKLTDTAFLFDNSDSKENKTYSNFAKYENKEISILTETIPEWFEKYILRKHSR